MSIKVTRGEDLPDPRQNPSIEVADALRAVLEKDYEELREHYPMIQQAQEMTLGAPGGLTPVRGLIAKCLNMVLGELQVREHMRGSPKKKIELPKN